MRLVASVSGRLFVVMFLVGARLCQYLSYKCQQFLERAKTHRLVGSNMFHPPLAKPGLKIRFGLKLDQECPFVFPVFHHAQTLTAACQPSHKVTVNFR
jgi:hypothetical protein